MAETDPTMLPRPSDAEIEERIETAVEEFRKAAFWRAGQLWGNNRWLGVQALKGPWDVWIAQEILWETRPDLVLETGVYAGGSTLFYADMFELMGHGHVLGWMSICRSPLASHAAPPRHPDRGELGESGGGGPDTRGGTREARDGQPGFGPQGRTRPPRAVHAFADLVTPGCYLVVEDTAIGKPLGKHLLPGPAEALEEWLADGQPFEVDRSREKFLLTASPGGYLRRLEPDAQAS